MPEHFITIPTHALHYPRSSYKEIPYQWPLIHYNGGQHWRIAIMLHGDFGISNHQQLNSLYNSLGQQQRRYQSSVLLALSEENPLAVSPHKDSKADSISML